MAIERFFDASLYLLIATGFFTLAGTGKLDFLSIFFISTALVARGILLVRGREFKLSERHTNYATVLYVFFYVTDFFLLSGTFVYATVHLVLFSMAVKMFSVHRQRDNLYLALLSFLMVLAAAVLTVDSAFFFAFLVFLVLTATTFLSMEMKRSAEAATAQAREIPDPSSLGRALLTVSVALVMSISLAVPIVFYILPRTTNGYLSQLAQNNQMLTGFGNEVQLGQIGEIKQSSSIVMHVQVLGDSRGSFANMKWRGVALGLFDGRKWNNPLTSSPIQRGASGSFRLWPQSGEGFHLEAPANARAPNSAIAYRVMMEPIGTNVFFLAPFAEDISGNYHTIDQDLAGSAASEEPIGIYIARSNVSEIRADVLRKASGDIPAQIALNYLQLPKLDPRIPQLAAEITSGQTNDYDRARAVERYLMWHYNYTLKLSDKRPEDPLAEFLFVRKQGHCEYFASAMAIMLRTLRIPSRVVNGFRSGQFNDLTSSYIVRASEAHTWVEVYFPNYGWSTFDPTPPDPTPTSLLRMSRIGLYLDALGEFWREWVINYDFTHQTSLSFRTAMMTRSRWFNWKLEITRRYSKMLARARATDPRRFMERYGPILLGVVALLLLGINIRRLAGLWRNYRIAASPEDAPRAAASIWYERMTDSLARRGLQKRPAQTPAEFVTSIADPTLRRAVSIFTQHYHRARFGEMAEDAKRLPRLYAEVDAAARG